MDSPDPRHLPVLQPGSEGEGLLLVGDLARATGKTVRAIHLYEDLGLLRPEKRSKGSYRLFPPDSVLRVRWIGKLQNLGLSLPEIQELVRQLENAQSAQFAAARLRSIYQSKLEDTRRKVRELTDLERELQASLRYLDSCDVVCAPGDGLESCTSCARNTATDTPDLVAGVRAH
jgi:MerR family transcriptional regulator, copper efflux regulator